MNQSSDEKKRVTLGKLHRAIETLAIQQAQIGIAAKSILLADQQTAEERLELIEKVSKAIGKLHELATDFLETPYDD